MNQIVIIGAGIHGLTSGIKLAQNGYDVTILEKNSDILMGASGATHNRAHMGYHYPRSISTAKECIKGLNHILEIYPDAIDKDNDSYYMMEKSSYTSLLEYEKFCEKINIPFEKSWPHEDFLKRDNIKGGILTQEPVFNINKLREALKLDALQNEVKIMTLVEIVKFHNDPYKLEILQKGNKYYLPADIILNATYAYSNNILKILDLKEDLVPYKLQHTEVAVVKSPIKLPSITIMDGPFVSLMKYGGKENHYLLYDVKNSVINEEHGFFMEDKEFGSNFLKMVDRFKKYMPFMDQLEYVESWWGTRPIPQVTGDSRNTRIKHHEKYPGIYSILEGKFISATLIAEKFLNIIQ